MKNRLTVPTLPLAIVACTPQAKQPVDTPQPAPGVICTMEARSAIQVTVLDQQGGRLPSGATVRVTARLEGIDARRPPTPPEAPYADTASVVATGDTTSVGLAHERAGVFTVSVSSPGYQPSTVFDVYVAKTPDGCHVQTQRVTARLQR